MNYRRKPGSWYMPECHFLLSPHLKRRLILAGVDRQVRGWKKTNEHAPEWIELKDK